MVTAAPARRTASKGGTLVVVCLALFLALLDSVAISLALPAIRTDLHTAVSGLVWVADGYVLVFAALLLTSGSLGDRFGRVGMFRVGLAVFTAGSAVCALAPAVPVLVAGRMVQGLGAALVTPQTLAILTQTFPDGRQRARAFGVWSGVSGLALLLGPVIGGALVSAFGWRSVFLINLPVGVAALLAGLRVLRRVQPAHREVPLRRSIDLPGQVLGVAWLGTLTYALVEGDRLGWVSAPVLALFAAAVVAFAALLIVERRASAPMLRLGLFRSPTFSASTVVIALVASGMYASFFLISLFLQQVQGYPAGAAGVRFLPAMGAVVLTSPLAGLLAGRLGSRVPVVAGCVLLGGSLLLLSRVGADDAYGGWWPLLVSFGVGIGLVIPPVNSALMGSVPAEHAGLASATGESGQQVGALVGIAVLGAVVTDRFAGVVADGAGQAGLSTADTRALARTLFSRGGSTVGGGDHVAALVERALTSGIQSALLVAGLAGLLGALVGLAIRRTPTAGPAESGDTPPADGPVS